MPTYNRAYVIWKAINSVLAQTFDSWELIVVDDGSQDSTQRLLEEFADKRIRSIRTDNRGPAAARNTGMAQAKGELIAYLDSDNTWHSDFLSVFDKAARSDQESVVWYCGQETTFYERTATGTWKEQKKTIDERAQYSIDQVWELGSPDTNAIVHRPSAGEAVNGWDEDCRWLEDWDFFLRLCLQHPNRWRHIPKTLVNYRQVHGSGADGICAEAREDSQAETAGRQYLIDKWKAMRPKIQVRLARS